MRLTSFTLENYGCFAQARLALDPEPGHVNLVPAPNGRGKTVLRQAFRDLLFGIPGQTKMAFLYGYQGMRLFAEGIDVAGSAFAFGRRKGIGNTLVDAAGISLDPRMLAPLIGEADEALFERLFGLDSQLLRSGAESMLKLGGALAEALFAAGSGIASVRRLREKFEEVRDQLAPGRQAKARPFYQALDKLAGARRDLHAATVRPRDWRELQVQLEFIRDCRSSLVRKQAEIRSQIERLQRVKRVRPWLDRWQDLQQRCAVAAGAPRLPADTKDRWRKAQQRADVAGRALNGATEALQAVAEELLGEQPDEMLLDQGPRIEDAERAQTQIAADQRDLPRREAERREAAIQIENALSALGHKAFDEIAAITPRGPRIAAARDLVKRHGVLTERLENAAGEAARCALAIAAPESELERIGEPPDLGDLAALLAEARAEGEPRRRLSNLQAKLGQEEAKLTAALAKVPLWDRGLEPLVALVPPTRKIMERAAAVLASTATELADAEREVFRLRQERAEAADRQNEARQGKPAPDEAAIATARSRRDHGWSLIRRSRFEDEPLKAEIEAYAAEVGLAASFERAIGTADELADRRDEESSRLATIATLDSTIVRFDRHLVAAESWLAEARQARREALQAWTAVAGTLGFTTAPDPGDLRDFLAARATVLDLRAVRDTAYEAVTAELAQQESMRLRFIRLMPLGQTASLSEAFVAAEQSIERATALSQRRNQLQTELQTMRRLHRQAIDDHQAAQAAFVNWQVAWGECLSQLN